MLSLRAGSLQLIALRGGLLLGGRPVRQVALAPGLTVHLARDLALHVLDLTLPEALLAVRVDDGPWTPLDGSVQSLVDGRWVPGHRADAELACWYTGRQWLVRPADGEAHPLAAGAVRTRDGRTLTARSTPMAGLGLPSTAVEGSGGLHLVVRYTSAHVHRADHPVLSLSGSHARLLTELVQLSGPAPWQVVAQLVWRRLRSPEVLRRRLDGALFRLRRKLEQAGVRTNLVHADGQGHLELLIGPFDRVEDLS